MPTDGRLRARIQTHAEIMISFHLLTIGLLLSCARSALSQAAAEGLLLSVYNNSALAGTPVTSKVSSRESIETTREH